MKKIRADEDRAKTRAYARKWRTNNPEKAKETSKRYMKAHRKELCKKSMQWHWDNHEKSKERAKKWRRQNPEKRAENYARWKKANPIKIKEYDKTRALKRSSDPQWKLYHRMSTLIRQSIRSNKAGRKWESLVDYSLHDLKKHFEKLFKKHPGMGWHNISIWEIDHIVPNHVFNYIASDDVDFKRCWALSNLQPLWAKDNARKGGKLNKPFQLNLPLKDLLI